MTIVELSPISPIVLNRLIKRGGLTRSWLQGELGVSGPTVTRAIAELADNGLIVGTSDAAGGKGRPAETICIDPAGLCTLAVRVHADITMVRLLDANGASVAGVELAVSHATPYAEAVSAMAAALADLAAAAAGRFRVLAGVGVSFYGAADYAAGAIAEPSAFPNWHHRPLAHDLAARTGLPVAIENYSVAVVDALNWFAPERQGDFFLVVADYGIGGIASIGGQAFLGARRSPAGFGHVGGRRRGRLRCHCGAYDCLTTVASLHAVRDRAAEVGLHPRGGGAIAEMVADLDASEDAVALLDEAGGRLAEAALVVCRGIGLATCVFGGALFDHAARARAAARRVFAEPGHDCRAEFLGEALAGRSIDDLVAGAIAYRRLAQSRQIHRLTGRNDI